MLDGKKYYFSVDEWRSLSRSERSSLDEHKCGVVIDYDDSQGRRKQFVTALNFETNSPRDGDVGFEWQEAMDRLGDRMPTISQGEAMARQSEAVCNAIKAFGGDSDPDWWYWTSTEYSASEAWYFSLFHRDIEDIELKCGSGYVRAVWAI